LWVERVVGGEEVEGAAVRRRSWEWEEDADENQLVAPGGSPAGRQVETTRRERSEPDESERAVTWSDVREELGRLAAMVSASDPAGLELALAPLTLASHPTDDLHGLLVAARLTVPVSDRDRGRIARVLAGLDGKLSARRLNQDRNWGPRLAELYERLRDRVPGLEDALLELPEFGQAAHAWLVEGMSGERRRQGLRV
jgi:hypothetical protein